MTSVFNSRSTLFQIIIQYVLNDNKNNIFKIPNPGSFEEYLKFSLNVQNNVVDKIFDVDKIRALNEIYTFITYPDLSFNDKIDKYYNATNGTIFYNEKFNNIFCDLFFRCQKVYHILIRFFKICKIKIKRPRNQFDLDFEKNLNYNNSLPIIHNDELYLFSKNDIIKLFFNSLVNSNFQFDSDPKRVRNPYTNLNFSLHHLYNMYFYIKHNSYNIDNLINNFYFCNFKIHNFVINYDDNITFLNIKRFVNNGFDKDIYSHIRDMIIYFNKEISGNGYKINLFKHFPSKTYIHVFKLYLLHYLSYKNICNTTISFNHWVILKKKLKRFVNKTPCFGRLLLSKKKRNSFGNKNYSLYKYNNKTLYIYYNTEYIDFYKDILKNAPIHIDNDIIDSYININQSDILQEPVTPDYTDSSDDDDISYEPQINNILIIQNDNDDNDNINQHDNNLNIDQIFNEQC
tara:strand:- start:5059 stop:6432 length:1374 start_codon:yes stop_codon:yes gene_type:complete